MQNLVYLNGEYVPAAEAKISIFDGAISLGMTVTESTRTFAHQPFRCEIILSVSTSVSKQPASMPA